jgi:hypothetical protein
MYLQRQEIFEAIHEKMALAWAFDPDRVNLAFEQAEGWQSDEQPPWKPTFEIVYNNDTTDEGEIKKYLLRIMNNHFSGITLSTEITSYHIKCVKEWSSLLPVPTIPASSCPAVEEEEGEEPEWPADEEEDFTFDDYDGAFPMEDITNNLEPRRLFQDGEDWGLTVIQRKQICSDCLTTLEDVMANGGGIQESDYIKFCNMFMKLYRS